mmetsp:Transcript_5234/g.7699  ORF Transcript_5234/g.7699 Transcript_5234/m.7699 type:complete len:615 (+) Transcript_5234:2-1846(+)
MIARGSMLLVGAKGFKILAPLLYKLVFDQIEAAAKVTSSPDALLALQSFWMVVGLIIGHTLAKSISEGLHSLNTIIFTRSCQGITRDQGQRIISKLMSLDSDFHLKANYGSITRTVERGLRATNTVLTRLFMNLLPQFAELMIVAYIIQTTAGTSMMIGSVLTIVAYAAFTLITVQRRNKYIRAMNLHDNESTGSLLQTLNNQEVVQTFNQEKRQVNEYDSIVKDYQKAQLGSFKCLASLNFGQKSIEAIGQGALLFRTAYLVMTGQITIGDLLMVNALLAQLMGPLDHLGANYMQITQGLVDGKEFYQLMKTPTKIEDKHPNVKLNVSAGEVRFENVSFAFELQGSDEGSTKQVFKNLNLTIPAGATVALVGESGSGKSTLGRLLTRGFDVDKGKILVDNQDVRDVGLYSLRDSVAVVSQEPKLFDDNILYNLKYGKPQSSNSEAIEIAKAVQLATDVSEMTDGYRTEVGDRGGRISGGQRQRVGLGRALLKDPPILVCDEVTSALDVNTESKLMKELKRLREGKTTILIAHRLSTITSADKIIVLDDGKVAESGTHDELLKDEKSLYSAMWKNKDVPKEKHSHSHDDDHGHDSHSHSHEHDHEHAGCCGHDH